ncbi:hypothetical protein Tco_0138950 [Tanacetum coccineum]
MNTKVKMITPWSRKVKLKITDGLKVREPCDGEIVPESLFEDGELEKLILLQFEDSLKHPTCFNFAQLIVNRQSENEGSWNDEFSDGLVDPWWFIEVVIKVLDGYMRFFKMKTSRSRFGRIIGTHRRESKRAWEYEELVTSAYAIHHQSKDDNLEFEGKGSKGLNINDVGRRR